MRDRPFCRGSKETAKEVTIIIQEKGVNLSGGQKQRLLLARGIFATQSSDIVLLNEPTRSADPKTEALIYDNMLAEFSDKAAISTLHHPHPLTKFEYRYILYDVHIVDEGSFTDLRRNSKFGICGGTRRCWRESDRNILRGISPISINILRQSLIFEICKPFISTQRIIKYVKLFQATRFFSHTKRLHL